MAISVAAVPRTTGDLAASSDTGVSSSDRITRDNTPTFAGNAPPGFTIRLSERPAGSSQAWQIVGVAPVDAAGNYSVTSNPQADGLHEFQAEAFRADGSSTGAVGLDDVLIDTVAPRVNCAVLTPQKGQILVVFQDQTSGLAASTLADTGNYGFVRQRPRVPQNLGIGSASVQPVDQLGAPPAVVLRVGAGRLLHRNDYRFTIRGKGITDVAGNPLTACSPAPCRPATAGRAATSTPHSSRATTTPWRCRSRSRPSPRRRSARCRPRPDRGCTPHGGAADRPEL